ncbi:hypothetical protein F5X68DRAFT_140245 [Plectosphaerella plurivora]|uniref:Uncharacterized protein n=1 Tax=Plectosphaerella plurivora TaxID=936078 RepID=A0A9P9A886_9PEZI|nr:hypothetical protein F5X68DRAFT_140245 [Plectosphaerella plurivora]
MAATPEAPAAVKPDIPVTEQAVAPESPEPSTQEEGKPGKTRWSALFDDWYYAWEVFGIIVSGLAIVSICVVVWYYDDKEAPVWVAQVPGRDKPFQFTINSLLSILSVFGSTCAMIPVTKGLGQLKYLWFMEKDRTLADLETFDSASRGKVGSAQLMWKLRFKHLAVLGGLASLLALAYGPFVQNLIVITIEYRPGNQTALASFTSSYHEGYEFGDNQTPMSFAIDSALRDSSVSWTIPPNLCKTGSCEWPDYYTAGVCARCTDISHLVSRECTPVAGEDDMVGGCNVFLPNGFGFNNTGSANLGAPLSKIVMAVNTTTPPLVYNYTTPLAVIQSIMGYDPKQNAADGSKPSTLAPFSIDESSVLTARECALVPCVQKQRFNLTRRADTSKGQSANIQESVPSLSILDDHWDTWDPLSVTGPPENWGDVYVTFDLEKEIPNVAESIKYGPFGFGRTAYWALRDYLSALLTGYVFTGPLDGTDLTVIFKSGVDTLKSTSATDKAMMSIFLNSQHGNWTGTFCNNTLGTSNDLECAARNIAAGVTNGMRISTWETVEDERRAIDGVTKEPMQICHAQWQYVAAPVAVWLLGLALFIGVVWKTRRAGIKAWRTSPLATLLLRLDPDSREHLRDWQNKGDGELRDLAAGLRLRLHVDEAGPRFVKEEGGATGRV